MLALQTGSHVTFKVVFPTEILVTGRTSKSFNPEVNLVKMISDVVGGFEHLLALSTNVFRGNLSC